MKQIVCIYCEGNDTKIGVFEKDTTGKIKVHRVASIDLVSNVGQPEEKAGLSLESDELSLEALDKETQALQSTLIEANISTINNSLAGINLSNALFIPALTEPAIYFHVYEGIKNIRSTKITQEIIDDIQETKHVSVEKESIGYIELADKSLLSVFVSGEISCVNMINSLAAFNNKRNYKIPTIKCAEVSLAYYVAKKKKFFPDDHSLIVYIGKEYSKLIFLQGRKLKHIGSTLDIGTQNLHTYDVYFSKILLEMENGGISSLDNIIVCGEDDSENLILSFYGTFPEANVSRLEFDDLDSTLVDAERKEKFSSFTVPLAVATEYFDEQTKETKGINLLPKYIREEQKFFQFSWHGYAMLPILFVAAFFITQQILNNSSELSRMDDEITQKTILMKENQEILNKIKDVETKISSFDQTQAILDSAAVGTELWGKVTRHVANFCQSRKNLWLTKISKEEDDQVLLEGYALSKNVLTDFAYSIESSILKSVVYEALREENAYRFIINFNITNFSNKNE